MGKIRQLSDDLANKIAAGEVVERPANVVKELVENSIDANAKKIDILITEGGIESIQIIDNGDGMSKADALLCFSRHATSKIQDENDLFNIQTLGFRGEAIPSIASISEFILKTSDGESGTTVFYRFGKCETVKESDVRKGTDITVSKIFQNVPARLKYLKSVNAEFNAIQKYIENLALSKPDIAFMLVHNGRQIFKTNGNGNLLEVIANIYGLQAAKTMIEIHREDDEFTLTGYISKIETTRATKGHIVTMVNHRVVRNKLAIDEINNQYRKYLFDNRYPIAVINIEVDPYLVDVNVHPSKLEVRFSKEMKLRDLIGSTVANALASINQTYTVQSSRKVEPFTYKEPEVPLYEEQQIPLTFETKEPIVKEESIFTYNEEKEDVIIEDKQVIEEVTEETTEEVKSEVKPRTMAKKLFVKGQVHGTYIIAEDDSGMYIIDQHAGQERINFEYFTEKFSHLDMSYQDLIVPITLDFPLSEYLKIEESKDKLDEIGIHLESFGDHSFVVKQLPLWMNTIDPNIFIEEMVNELLHNRDVDVMKLRKDAIATLSCKASLKGNTHLSMEGMQYLVDHLMMCENPYVCPHGRPTIIYYSTYEIEKLFKRVV